MCSILAIVLAFSGLCGFILSCFRTSYVPSIRIAIETKHYLPSSCSKQKTHGRLRAMLEACLRRCRRQFHHPVGGEDGFGEGRPLRARSRRIDRISPGEEGEKAEGMRCAKARHRGEGDETTRPLQGTVRYSHEAQNQSGRKRK